MNPDPNKKARVRKLNRLPYSHNLVVIRLLLLFCLGDGVFLPMRAAQPPAPLTLSSNRYLFIVDTSFSMRNLAPSVLQTVGKLLMSDMNGNLRRGDTLGVWTFNEQLHAGRFPLQVWSPDRRQAIALRVTEFLKKQPLEKKTDLNVALTQMFQVIKNSDNIIVILFSDGDEQIRGTPFDDEINAVYREQHRKMQKAGTPFVTVLRAKGGEIVNHSVNFAPWPIDIPIFPTPYEAAQLAAAQATPTNPPPTAVSAATNPPALPPSEKKVELAAEAPAVKPEVPPIAVTPPAAPKPTVTAPVVETPKTEVAAAKLPAPAPTVVAEVPKKELAEPLTAPPPKSAPPPVVAPTVAKTETPATAIPQAETKPLVEPAESKTEKTISEPTPLASAASAEVQAANPPETPIPAVQTAVAVPPETFFSGKGLLIAATALLLAATGLTFLLVRRARTVSQPSLITRSMDKGGK